MKRVNGFLILTTYPLSLASFIHLFIEFNTQSVCAFLLFLTLSFCINLMNIDYVNAKNRKAILNKFRKQEIESFCQIKATDKFQNIFSEFEKANFSNSVSKFRKTNDQELKRFFGHSAQWLYVIRQKPNKDVIFSSAEVYVFPDAPDFVFMNDYPKDIFREYDLFHEISHTSVASTFVNHFYSQQFFQWCVLFSFCVLTAPLSFPSLICGIFILTYPFLYIIGYWENDIELITDYNSYLMMTSKGYNSQQLIPIRKLHERKYEALLEEIKYKPYIKNFFLLNYTSMRKNLIDLVVKDNIDFSRTKSSAVLVRNKWIPTLKLIAIGYVALHFSYNLYVLFILTGFIIIFLIYYFKWSFDIHVASTKNIIETINKINYCGDS